MVRVDGLNGADIEWALAGWSYDREVLTQTVEMLDKVRVQVAATTGDKKVKRWKPIRLPRPDLVRPKKKSGTWVDLFSRLAKEKRKKGG